MCRKSLLQGAAALAAAAMILAPLRADAEPSFAGKTIHLVVNFTAGGAVDSFFRLIAPTLERHLPGNPKVVVENRPGAGGRVAAAYVYNVAKLDGLTIGGMAGIANDVFSEEDVKFDATKFTWLGAVPQTQVMVVRKDLGLTSYRDLPKKQLVLAESGENSNNFIASALALKLMGASFKAVQGYQGQAQTVQAVRQGEANVTDVGAPFYLPNRDAWDREGVFRAVLQRGDLQADGTFRRSPLLPDLATMPEAIGALNPKGLESTEFVAYRMIAGSYALQYAIIAPRGLPGDLAEALRKSVAAALADREAIEAVQKRLRMTYTFVPGAEAATVIAKMPSEAQAHPAALALIRKMSAAK